MLSLLDDPEGWEIGVFNNLGWCYGIHNKYMQISAGRDDFFIPYMHVEEESGGDEGIWHDFDYCTHTDINECIRRKVETARKYTTPYSEAVEYWENKLNKSK